MDDLILEFVAETREGLEALDSELVRFEQRPDDPEILGNVFRLIHTIKGTCGFLGLVRLQSVAHAAENVLGGFRDGSLGVTAEAVSAVLETVDLIRGLIEKLARDGAEPAGDDSALIARLEAVLAPSSEAMPAASAPATADSRPLIQRVGGDATLDAAAETVAERLASMADFARYPATAMPLLLQPAIRGPLIDTARAESGGAGDRLRAAIDPALPDAAYETVLDLVGQALSTLDIDDASIAALRARLKASPAALQAPAPPAAAPPPKPAPAPAPATTAAPASEADQSNQTIRVSIDALENLMTVVSELVLLRNQLNQTLRSQPESPFAAPLHRLSQVTSELQEGVMTTRMQPISGAWAKVPRLVRDLARDLSKKIELETFGQETELDRQVLELIKDPLTHMIRNAADHGLETPAERLAAGKPEAGCISLHARHEGGAIVIEIADDGRGLSASRLRAKALSSGLLTPAQAEAMSDADAHQLIFRAGLSTAEQVTAVSGRGVGMDVVRTNIERIGGAIELHSVEGKGTRFTIRIPLTLTIVSALIVESCGVRFAMPQSSVIELVSASNGSGNTIEYINGAAVLRLRERLLPLVSLQALMGLPPMEGERTDSCIVVARVGSFAFGVLVDRVFDTEEIVVKPVASILRHLKFYSGATILGDGSVIMILDFKGISAETGASQGAAAVAAQAEADSAGHEPKTAMLLFRTDSGAVKAAALSHVARIEDACVDQIERVDGRTVLQYRGRLMPIVGDDGSAAKIPENRTHAPLLVFSRGERSIGLLVDAIVDIVETHISADLGASAKKSRGSAIVAGAATEFIDTDFYWEAALGEAPPPAPAVTTPAPSPAALNRRLLVIDDSPFTRVLIEPLLARAGYAVTIAATAAAAAALHDKGHDFDLIMADTGLTPDEARSFALALRGAARWHATPLVGLALQAAGEAQVLRTIDETLAQSQFRGAA